MKFSITSFLNSNKCTVELESFHFNNGIDRFLHALCDNSNDFKFIDWYQGIEAGMGHINFRRNPVYVYWTDFPESLSFDFNNVQDAELFKHYLEELNI